METVTAEILKTGGIIGAVVSLLLGVGWLIVKGGLIPKSSHLREIQLLQDQIAATAVSTSTTMAWITSDRDGYRGAYETERQRMDTLSDQVALLIEGQKTTVAMLHSISEAAARNASH